MRCSTLAESARLNVAGAQQEKSLSLLSSDAKLNSKPCPSLPMSGLRSCSRSRAKPGRVCVEHRQLANIRYIYTGTCNAVLGKGKAPRWARAHPCAKGLQKLPQNQLYVERTCRCFRFTWSKVVIVAEQVTSKSISVIPVLETNSIADSVENLIEKGFTDLIVMGSTGATGAKEIFIGSNAEKVVRSSSVPVLVIKDKTDIKTLKKIVFACDFSQKYENAFEKAIEFAKMIGAKIDFVYINTPYAFRTTREIKDFMEDFATNHKEIRLHNTHSYNDFRIEDGIINFAEDHQSDLICMFPIRRSGIAHFFNGSISEDIVNHSDKPVLTIKL